MGKYQAVGGNRELKILVAEDYLLNTLVLKNMLNQLNIAAEFFEDGEKLVHYYQKNLAFDIILMDIQMPRLDGFEASKLIRTFDKTIPIIACSAHLQGEILSKFKQYEINDYLQKPYTIEDLSLVIARNAHPN